MQEVRSTRLFGWFVRLAAIVFALMTLLLVLSPRYGWARHGWLLPGRILRFPNLARERDRHCTLADAWTATTPGHSRDSFVEILRQVRPIQADRGFVQVDTPAGRFWMPAGEEIALAEELEEQQGREYGDDVRGVHPGDIVLDCGASIGVFTRKALRSGASRVVAIEPAPWSLECLRRNLAEEVGRGRVVVYPKGVWDREDKLELTVPTKKSSTAGTLVLGGAARLTSVVALTTIDQLVAELQLPRVDFIKMDIEGAEPNALRGAAQTVARFHPRLAISLEHRTTDPETIPALTRRLWPIYGAECAHCDIMNSHLQPTMMFAAPGAMPVSR